MSVSLLKYLTQAKTGLHPFPLKSIKEISSAQFGVDYQTTLYGMK